MSVVEVTAPVLHELSFTSPGFDVTVVFTSFESMHLVTLPAHLRLHHNDREKVVVEQTMANGLSGSANGLAR
jgi:hypothetical protein